MDNFEKFCPVCKNKNERGAVACSYCGALLDEYPTSAAATTRNTDDHTNVPIVIGEQPLEASAPADGIAVYIEGTAKPVFLSTDGEFVIGRKTDKQEALGSILDLSDFGGFAMGISRQHVIIRKAEGGYEAVDLSSVNGTWLNDERLIPYRYYPFASGSQLRVGRMRLLVLYHSIPDPGRMD